VGMYLLYLLQSQLVVILMDGPLLCVQENQGRRGRVEGNGGKRDVLGDVDRGVHEEANMGKGKVGVWR
jgi:hypothetical protein